MMTHDELLEAILLEVRRLCLIAYWLPDSRLAPGKGFPDLVIAGPYGHLFAELKTPGQKLTSPQTTWRNMLVAGRADYHLWQPRDWDSGAIKGTLWAIAEQQLPYEDPE